MISFIIPTKNEESIIEQCLINLAGYSGSKEIIVSDGKSADKTLEIVKKYATVIVECPPDQKQNIAMGRNAGAKIATGDFLVFMDADVTVTNLDMFFGKALKIFELDSQLGAVSVFVKILPKVETLADKIVFALMNLNNLISNNYLQIGAAMGEFQMIRKSIFDKIGGYDQKLAAGEDYELFRRIAKISKTKIIKELSAYHTGRRIHKTGWGKLLPLWFMNYIFSLLFKKSFSKEWGGDIR